MRKFNERVLISGRRRDGNCGSGRRCRSSRAGPSQPAHLHQRDRAVPDAAADRAADPNRARLPTDRPEGRGRLPSGCRTPRLTELFGLQQLIEQRAYSLFDFFADRSYRVERLAGWVG